MRSSIHETLEILIDNSMPTDKGKSTETSSCYQFYSNKSSSGNHYHRYRDQTSPILLNFTAI